MIYGRQIKHLKRIQISRILNPKSSNKKNKQAKKANGIKSNKKRILTKKKRIKFPLYKNQIKRKLKKRINKSKKKLLL